MGDNTSYDTLAQGERVAVSDSAITDQVRSALVDDPTTKARQISVETLHGVVHLSGFVDSDAERDQATVVAHAN